MLKKFVSARAPIPGRLGDRSPSPFDPREPILIDDLEAHLAGGASNDAESGLVVVRI